MTDTRLLLVRHAPALHGGRLAGRRDVRADTAPSPALRAIRSRLTDLAPPRVLVSPARRCMWTACAIWPGPECRVDPRLQEQDFGAWEGLPFDRIPDLGPLPVEALAAHRPPGGESFLDMAARVRPALEEPTGTVAIIAHAGTVRAALSLVVGPAALGFAIAPLSLSVVVRSGGQWSVESVNEGGVK